MVLSANYFASAAYGYYTAGGASGSGTASAAVLAPVVVLAATGGSASSKLLPGGSADLVLELRNPNSSAVTITNVSQSGPVTVSGSLGCTSDPSWPTTVGNSGVSVPSGTGLGIVVASGPDVVVHVPAGSTMATSSASACQGATFMIPVSLVVRR